MATEAVITKAELAKVLGCSKARISQIVRAGLPVRQDGRLNRKAALAWVERNQVSFTGGWHHRAGRDIAGQASEALEQASEPTAKEFYNYLRARYAELSAILLQLGTPLAESAAAHEALDMIVGVWALAFDENLVSFTETAVAEPDYRALARMAGVPLKLKETRQQREEILERLAALLEAGAA